MKQILNGYKSIYYLDENCNVYNAKTNKFLKATNHYFKLQLEEKGEKRVSQKELYRIVYNKEFCIDQIELLENEVFKEIEETNGKYYISNFSRIKSYCNYNAIIISQYINHNGYYKAQLCINGKNKHFFTHILVCNAFCGKKPAKNYQCHHKDFTKNKEHSNYASNLEWIEQKKHIELHRQHEKEQQKSIEK